LNYLKKKKSQRFKLIFRISMIYEQLRIFVIWLQSDSFYWESWSFVQLKSSGVVISYQYHWYDIINLWQYPSFYCESWCFMWSKLLKVKLVYIISYQSCWYDIIESRQWSSFYCESWCFIWLKSFVICLSLWLGLAIRCEILF